MFFQAKELGGVAQLRSRLAYGRAEPYLTTAGKAEFNETGLLRQSPPAPDPAALLPLLLLTGPYPQS